MGAGAGASDRISGIARVDGETRPSLGDFDYHSRIVDETSLKVATATGDERPFVREAVACLEELSQSISVVAGLQRVDANGAVRPMTRNDAILGGLMVRCSKLQHAVLDAADKERIELLTLALRGITEAAVNLRYLLEHGTPQMFDDFVRDSLRVDKGLRDRILSNAAERSGVLLPIEDRMLEGIDQTFDVAGIDPESVDTSREWRGWSKGGIWTRFKALGLSDVFVQFEVESHYIHGSWHDIYAHHVHRVPGGFQPDLRWGAIRPQALVGPTVVLGTTAALYLRDVAPEWDDVEILEDRMRGAVQNGYLVQELHEQFLAQRSGGTNV